MIDNKTLRDYMRRLLSQVKENLERFEDVIPVIFFLDVHGNERFRVGLVFHNPEEKIALWQKVNEKAAELKPAVLLMLADANRRDPMTGVKVADVISIFAYGPGVNLHQITEYKRSGQQVYLLATEELVGDENSGTMPLLLKPWWQDPTTVVH